MSAGQQQHELIEQFGVLLKMCKGASTRDPVRKALESPGLFVFGELVSMPSLQQVSFCLLKSCALKPLKGSCIHLKRTLL